MRLRWVGVLAVMTMVLASCGGGAPEAAGPSEGIQVHGDWTIDIYNEDGSLDRHVEFSNALVETGADKLVGLLLGGGAVDAQSWLVALANACPGACLITDITAIGIDTTGAVNLLDGLSLAGEVVAENDGTIDAVASGLGTCPEDVAPSTCQGSLTFPAADGSTFQTFTEKVLDPADQVEVTTGQTIEVEVQISFTSG